MSLLTHIDADFYAFFYASLWALGASVAFAHAFGTSKPVWRLLGTSWALRSLLYCFDLFQIDSQAASWIAPLEILLNWVSSVGVFAAAIIFLNDLVAPQRRLIVLLSFATLSAGLIISGDYLTDLRADTVGLAARLCLAFAWFGGARTKNRGESGLRAAGTAIAFYGVAFEYGALVRSGLLEKPAGFFAGIVIGRVLEFVTLGLVFLLLEQHSRKNLETGFRSPWRAGRLLISLVLTIAAALVADELGIRFEEMRKAQIMSRARLAAASVPLARLPALDWSEKDLENPAYQELKALMKSLVGSDRDLRFVLLAGMREGKSYFIVDSENPNSKDYSPPGQLYEEADQSYLDGMSSRRSFLLGPVTDRWGTWMVASVPLATFDGRGINVELDIAASDWNAVLRMARLPAFLLGFLLIVVALVIFHARQRIKLSLAVETRAKEEKHTIIESSPDAVQMVGRDRKFITANQITATTFGVPLGKFPSLHFEEIWPASVRGLLRSTAESTLAGNIREIEIEYRTATGEDFAWRVATNPIRDELGQTSGFVATCCNITARKRSERQLGEAKEAAEIASKAKSEFLAVMSHEIRTPLGAVIGLLELLRADPAAADRKRYSSLASQSAKSLLHILDDLLDASKIEAGKMTIENVPFDLQDEAARVLESMRARAELKNLHLNWSFPDSLPAVVIGDPTRLKQIITNLISNAIKFTAQGGVVVSIKMEWHDAGRIMLHLKISDSGIGMSREVMQKLFSKFQQADASTTRQFGGTGLGLSIVRGLLDCMGGSINVESEVGKGTAFSVAIPMWLGVDTGKTTGRADTAAPWAVTCPRLQVLCADDDAINREYIGDTLKLLGHHVAFAENGREAVEKLKSARFDAVLMDNRMPVMDGFQAARAIRDGESGEANRNIYIIAVTANVSAAYHDQCTRAGMNAYLTKPVAPADLDAELFKASQHSPRRDSKAPMPELMALSADQLLASLDAVSEPSPTAAGPALSPKLVSTYLRETPRRLQEMTDALGKNDLAGIGRVAHMLKGNSRYVGADDIAILASQIQDLADLNDGTQMESLVIAIGRAYAEKQPFLEKQIEEKAKL